MKIAIYQGPGTPLDVGANLETLARQAELAAAESARLLIAPEMILSGYNIGAEAIADRAEASDGSSAQALAEIARRNGIGIVYGYPERCGERVYNSAQMLGSDGSRLANYRKTHLFGNIDRDAFSAGNEATVIVEFEGWQIGLLICYDVEFPENLRRLRLAGADFIVVPTALMPPYEFVASHMLPTRAFENGVFVAYANRCARENDLDYVGLSCVVGPDGVDLARAQQQETLIFAELDRNLLVQWRRVNTYIDDRIPAHYGTLTDSTGTTR